MREKWPHSKTLHFYKACLSPWSLHVLISTVAFLQIVQLPPTVQKHAHYSKLPGDSKLRGFACVLVSVWASRDTVYFCLSSSHCSRLQLLTWPSLATGGNQKKVLITSSHSHPRITMLRGHPRFPLWLCNSMTHCNYTVSTVYSEDEQFSGNVHVKYVRYHLSASVLT